MLLDKTFLPSINKIKYTVCDKLIIVSMFEFVFLQIRPEIAHFYEAYGGLNQPQSLQNTTWGKVNKNMTHEAIWHSV